MQTKCAVIAKQTQARKLPTYCILSFWFSPTTTIWSRPSQCMSTRQDHNLLQHKYKKIKRDVLKQSIQEFSMILDLVIEAHPVEYISKMISRWAWASIWNKSYISNLECVLDNSINPRTLKTDAHFWSIYLHNFMNRDIN